MEPVEEAHDPQIVSRHRPWQVVHAATADAQGLRLLRDGQLMLAHDHRLALSKPALPSATSKESFSSSQSWRGVTSRRWAGGGGPGACRRPEHPGSPFLKLQFPPRDLVGVNVEMLSQLGYRVLAPNGGQRHLRLKGRCVGPACAFAHCIS